MENVAIYPTSRVTPTYQRLDQVISWLVVTLAFLFPFQKRFSGAFRSFSDSLVPTDIAIPSFFSKKIDFYSTDLIIILIGALCFYRFRDRLRTLLFDGPSKFLIGFLVISLISISFSVTASYPLQYYRLFQLSIFILLFCSLFHFLQHVDGNALIKQIFWAFFFASLIECVIGISQYFLQHSIGLKSLGEVNISHFAFFMEGGRRWIFDNASAVVSGKNALYRSSGTFTHPNVLGGFLFVSILMTYYLIFAEEKKLARRLLYAAMALQIFTLSITFSRAAIFATGLSSCIWLGSSVYEGLKAPGAGCKTPGPRKSASKGRFCWVLEFCNRLPGLFLRRRLMILCTSIIAFSTCLFLFYDQFFFRGGIVNYNQIVSDADGERVVYQKIAWKMFEDHPILGVGHNNFQIFSPHYAPKERSSAFFAKVHNIYLLVLAETGILGMTFFLLFLLWLARSVRMIRSDEKLKVVFSISIGVLFIGCCDYYLLHTPHGKLLLFIVAGLLSFPWQTKSRVDLQQNLP